MRVSDTFIWDWSVRAGRRRTFNTQFSRSVWAGQAYDVLVLTAISGAIILVENSGGYAHPARSPADNHSIYAGLESRAHQPVLLNEAIDLLQPRAGGSYIDATVGAGGHSREILSRSSPDGRLIAIDRDPRAIPVARANLAEFGDRVNCVAGNFADIERIAWTQGAAPADGILLDLGVSSMQLDDPGYGFSFQRDGPLDLRFDPTVGMPAHQFINTADEGQIANVLFEYGEERRSRHIARQILRERRRRPITTTVHLRRLVESAVGRRGRINPATRTFQALRIYVNDEIESLKKGLEALSRLLNSGARLVVIAFHSLEDRIVKRTFAEWAAGCVCPPGLAECHCGHEPTVRLLTRRVVKPGTEEVRTNPRSRSARLRACERLEKP